MQAQNIMENKEFDWVKEINNTVVESLVSSFGIDFILLEDKEGGHVNTVHNVRNGIWATEDEKQRYENRGQYDSDKYHSHSNYKRNNKQNSENKKNGILVDGYTGETVSRDAKMDLDHIIAAKQIHDDPGRVLAEIEGTNLANKDENLVAANRSVNRSKQADRVEDFIAKRQDKIRNKQQEVDRNKRKLENLQKDGGVSEKEIRDLKTEIQNGEEYIEQHKKINEKLMLKKAKKAQAAIDREINLAYYRSTKFFKNTATASISQGARMGSRQVVGLLLAETWFEIKEVVPNMYLRYKSNFTLEQFLVDIKDTFSNIFYRIKTRFNDLISRFFDGSISGILSTINSTIINIFLKTEKIIEKLLRELWTSLTKATKLLFFNPNNLSLGALFREVSKILATGISVALGAILHQQLAQFIKFIPFSDEISAFISAVVSGVMTLGAIYFIEHSALMRKVWDKLDQLQNIFKSQYTLTCEYYQKVNIELDRYLIELSSIELNMNPDEISAFADALGMAKTEEERERVLNQEIKHRNIQLPFEEGHSKEWLLSIFQKN